MFCANTKQELRSLSLFCCTKHKPLQRSCITSGRFVLQNTVAIAKLVILITMKMTCLLRS